MGDHSSSQGVPIIALIPKKIKNPKFLFLQTICLQVKNRPIISWQKVQFFWGNLNKQFISFLLKYFLESFSRTVLRFVAFSHFFWQHANYLLSLTRNWHIIFSASLENNWMTLTSPKECKRWQDMPCHNVLASIRPILYNKPSHLCFNVTVKGQMIQQGFRIYQGVWSNQFINTPHLSYQTALSHDFQFSL